MVTKYDVFELVYTFKSPMRPIEVVEKLNKGEKEYHVIHRILRELVKENFLNKTKYGFEAKITKMLLRRTL